MIGLIQWLGIIFFFGLVAGIIAVEAYREVGDSRWSNLTSRRQLRRVWLMASLPLVFGVTAVGLTLLPGLLDFAGITADHCHLHEGHSVYHLCWHRPPPLSNSMWVNGVWTLLLALPVVGIGSLVRESLRARRVRQKLRGAQDTSTENSSVGRLDTDRLLAMTVGLFRPTTVVSEGLRRAVSESQWKAILAHEQAHVRRYDGLRRAVFRLLTLFFRASTRTELRRQYGLAVESLCDEYAARRTDAFVTAEALVTVAKRRGEQSDAQPRQVRGGLSFGAMGLEKRVETLVSPESENNEVSSSVSELISGLLLAIVAVVVSPWFHSFVENTLNMFLK